MNKTVKSTLSKAIAVLVGVMVLMGGVTVNVVKAEETGSEGKTSAQIVNEMGVGWNLGNTLDAYSTTLPDYNKAQQKRDKYQMMAMYSTKYYSGWDASSVPYFSTSNSECSLTWNMTTLNSKNQACGRFGFQIINNSLVDTGTNNLNFTVTKAQFTTANGTIIVLSDMLGTYSKPLANKVTTYVFADLTKISQLATTSDVLGGTLNIVVKINEYPMPKIITSVTKETYYETLWGNPVTTKAMIDMVKQAGFGVVRIPVTYYNHMDAQGNIDAAWLERVSQVVQYVLDNDMYCIINMHHDTGDHGWIRADLSTIDATGTKLETAWTQIAGYFKEYNDKLIFEGFNEVLNTMNQWSWAGQDAYTAANRLNQIFVDTVRNTGGNNSERCLIVNSYAASFEEEVLSHFELPQDTIDNRLVIGVHYYGSQQAGISAVLNRLNTKFVSKGIPVIIGEFATDFKMEESKRVASASYYVATAKKYNITCLWWDDGNYDIKVGAKCYYSILDKCALKWYHPAIAQAIVAASKTE